MPRLVTDTGCPCPECQRAAAQHQTWAACLTAQRRAAAAERRAAKAAARAAKNAAARRRYLAHQTADVTYAVPPVKTEVLDHWDATWWRLPDAEIPTMGPWAQHQRARATLHRGDA